jgi:photosystem II stability/assembly factor-like uncharacterized protein
VSRGLALLVGTRKGAFVVAGDADRREWHVRGPFCETWPVHHLNWDARRGALLAGAGSPWYGAAVWRSTDLGETWTHSSEGLSYGDDGPKLESVWNVTPVGDAIYAGVQPAGLFRSDDQGETWTHVAGLREHPSRPEWQPGAGGLILHSIVADPRDASHMWVAISAVGTFETRDGGKTWETRNRGVRADFVPGPAPEFGQCVHKLVLHPARPDVLYQQNHCGVYRSDDGSATWTEITGSLPSDFGFPMAVHPQDPRTVYVIPLNGADKGRHMPDGRAAVWRSRDEGGTWQRLDRGLPTHDAYVGVLREAMATDALEPAGIYFGTSTGQLFGSHDEGDSWNLIADFLPSIWSVEAVSLDA